MAPTEGSKLLGKLSRGFTTGVQTGVSSLMSVNALLQGARTAVRDARDTNVPMMEIFSFRRDCL